MLRRRWQWIILIVGFFYQVIDYRLLAKPITNIAIDSPSDILSLACLLMVAIVLVHLQKRMIEGGSFNHYLSSLPVPTRIRWRGDLVILLVANNVLWIPFAIAVVILSPAGVLELSSALRFANVLLAACGLLLIQIYWLHGQRLLSILFAAMQLAAAYCDRLVGNNTLILLTGVFLIATVSAILFPVFPVRAHTTTWLPLQRGTGCVDHRPLRINLLRQLSAPLVVQWSILKNQGFSTLLSLFLAICVTAFTMAAIFLGQNLDIAPVFSILTASFVALVLSALFHTLQAAHRESELFQSTLPIAAGFWLVRDSLFVGVLFLFILAPSWVSFYASDFLDAGDILLSAVGGCTLILVLRMIVGTAQRHSVLLSSVATVCFGYLLGWVLR